jgi:hypothetical protein
MKTPFAATLALTAAFAVSSVAAETISERLESGAVSYAAFRQLVADAGVVEDEEWRIGASDVAEIERQDSRP